MKQSPSPSSSLRRTLLAALAIGFLLLSGSQYYVVGALVQRQLLQIESAEAFDQLANLHHALEVLKEDIASTTVDWAQWDEAFAYTTGATDDFDEMNLDPGSVARLRLSFVLVIGQDGEPLFARSLAEDGESYVDAPADLVALARGDGPLGSSADPMQKLTGFVRVSNGVFLLSSQPVLRSLEPSPPRGRMIMGRSLERFVLPALRRMTGQRIDALQRGPADLPPVRQQLLSGRDMLEVRDDELHGYTPLDDVWRRPVAQLRVHSERPTKAWLEHARKYLVGPTVVVGLLFTIAGSILLRFKVLAPLEQLAARVERLGREGDSASQLPPSSAAREFQTLSSSINDMLRQIEQQQAIRRDRDAAVEANRLKSEFVATMSHEIRTPMNGVLGMCELLQRTELDQRQRRLSDSIVRSARILMDILNDILDFSKIEAGKLELEQAPFSPNELLQSVCAPFAATAQAKGLLFNCRIGPDTPPHVIGDSLRLQQVLNNLLSNALKFTERGVISLTCLPEHSTPERVELRFTVSDTGVGIPTDALERIFQPFSQAESSTSRRFGGTGLGLAIVQRLVGAMGGEVSVRSEPGAGSTFSFSIRVQPVSEAAALRNQTLEATGPHFSLGSEPSVLLAEDNAVNREVLCEMLQYLGCRVSAVENGAEALAKAAEGSFEVVLMDCHMPVMDGVTAAAEWRALERATGRPPAYMIALTADVTPENRARVLEAGVNELAPKPISQAKLRTLIFHAVRTVRGRDEKQVGIG